MAKGLINDSTMTAIADAIRNKTGTSESLKPSEMASAINTLSGGAGMQMQSQTLASDGSSISFSGLTAQPSCFFLLPETEVNGTGVYTGFAVAFVKFTDGTLSGGYVHDYTSGSTETGRIVISSAYSQTFGDGTLKITASGSYMSNGGKFKSGTTYALYYLG